MKKIFGVLMILLVTFTLSGCKDVDYINIDNDELRTFLDDSENYQFVDVRTSSEYYKERIDGFNYNIDYYLLDEDDDHSDLDKLDKTIPVVIMCNSGNRSVSAALIFLDEGFETVYNLEDGIQGWDGETE